MYLHEQQIGDQEGLASGKSVEFAEIGRRGQTRRECHFKIALQTQQRRHKNKHLADLNKQRPVLQ